MTYRHNDDNMSINLNTNMNMNIINMKMKKYFLHAFVITLLITSLVSCSKDVINESSIEEVKKSSTLVVRTRTTDDASSSDEVSYPVAIYVFDEDDTCVDLLTMEEGETEVTFKLASGTYTICSLGGAVEENYSLPTEDEATPTSVVELADGMKYTELMTAKNDITLSDDETNTLTISLERQVMLIQSITMSNIPDDVTAVTVAFSPLYDDLCLNGEYNTSNASYSISLVQSEDEDGLWENEDEEYLFSASGTGTITVKLTTEEGVTSYSYACSDQLEKNYKINVEGTYYEDITVTGTITAVAWAGKRTISFTLGDSDDVTITETDDTGETTSTNVSNSSVPSVGDMYKGAFVYEVEENDDGSYTVYVFSASQTLIDVSEVDSADFSEDYVDKLIQETADELTESQEITSGWRLPTLEECKYIYDNLSEINELIALQDGVDGIYNTTSDTFGRYAVEDETYKFYIMSTGGKATYYFSTMKINVRVFNTITFM